MKKAPRYANSAEAEAPRTKGGFRMPSPTIPSPESEITPESDRKGPTFMIVPFEILYNDRLSPNAKLLYCRLILFSGKDGICNPSHERLAREIRVKSGQVRALLNELRKYSLVEWRRTQTSCSYTIHPPNHFADPDSQDTSVPSVSKQASGVSVNHQQKEVLKEGLKEVDLDLAAFREKRERLVDIKKLPASKEKQYPKVKDLLGRYWAKDPNKPKPEDYPSDGFVADLMIVADTDEDEVCRVLKYMYEDRRLTPRTQKGPNYWNWFVKSLPTNIKRWRKLQEAQEDEPLSSEEWKERMAG